MTLSVRKIFYKWPYLDDAAIVNPLMEINCYYKPNHAENISIKCLKCRYYRRSTIFYCHLIFVGRGKIKIKNMKIYNKYKTVVP